MKKLIVFITVLCLLAGITSAFADSKDIIQDFSDGLAAMKKDGLWGYIDTQGNWVLKPQWNAAWPHVNGVAQVLNSSGDTIYIDTDGKTVFPGASGMIAPSEGLAVVSNHAADYQQVKYGYIDQDGKTVIPFEYESYSKFSEGIAFVGWKDDSSTRSCGLIDNTGATLKVFSEGELKTEQGRVANLSVVSGYRDGYMILEGYVYSSADGSETGKAYLIADPDYNISYRLFCTSTLTTKLVACGNGVFVLETISFDSDRNKLISFEYINGNGEPVIDDHFSSWITTRSRADNEFAFRDGIALVGIDRKGTVRPAYIDMTGSVIISGSWSDAMPFSEGFAAVCEDGKWGYINTSGEYIIEPQYDQARSFSCGVAIVDQGDDWYIIDTQGNVLY